MCVFPLGSHVRICRFTSRELVTFKGRVHLFFSLSKVVLCTFVSRHCFFWCISDPFTEENSAMRPSRSWTLSCCPSVRIRQRLLSDMMNKWRANDSGSIHVPRCSHRMMKWPPRARGRPDRHVCRPPSSHSSSSRLQV